MATIPPITATPGSVSGTGAISDGAYRPEIWNQPALTMLTVTTPTPSNSADTGVEGGTQVFVFDAVFRLAHSQRIRKTEHPVQTGANIVDHAYILPADLVMEIGMSDAMDSFAQGMWEGSSNSKSVNAYQQILALQQSRIPITITTRLNTYQNMVIEAIEPIDEFKTRHALRATVRFSQIFFASLSQTGHSNSPQTTDSTQLGSAQPGSVPQGVTNNNLIAPGTTTPGVTVPGSMSPTGAASSNNTAQDPEYDGS